MRSAVAVFATAVALASCHRPEVLADRGRPAASAVGATRDAGPNSANSAVVGAASAVPVSKPAVSIQLNRPAPGSELTSDAVELAWTGAEDGNVELSSTRGFETTERKARSASPRVEASLERGTWFWRVRGRTGAETSPVWWFRVVGTTKHVARQGLVVGTDFDGDGVNDFAFRNSVLLGRGDLGSQAQTLVRLSPEPVVPCATPAKSIFDAFECGNLDRGAPVGDVDGDGFDDLVADTKDAGAVVWLGSSGVGPVWKASRMLGAHERPHVSRDGIVRLGDVNGDGFADVAFSEGAGEPCSLEFIVHPGSAAGLLTHGTATIGPYRSFIGGGDIDGDGIHDAIGLSRDGRVHLHLGRREGLRGASDASFETFQGTPSCQADRYVAPELALVDWNQDGLADVIAAWSDESPGVVPVFASLAGRASSPWLAPMGHLRWPFKECCKLGFSWAAVQNGSRGAPSLIVADRAWATEVVRVTRAANNGFSTPSRPVRVASEAVIQRFVQAVGDVDHDGLNDAMIDLVAAADGASSFELRSDAALQKSRFSWGDHGTLAEPMHSK